MSKSTIGLRKAGIASIATTALVMGAGFAGAGTASAVPGFTFDREAGADRYGTAADIATSFDATEDVSSVILASGQAGRFPDALSGNYLAGELNAPILLTRLNDMPASTRTALESLGDVDIKVVGGDGVISDAQLDALRADGYDVQRFGGPVRYDTNAEVIEAGGTTTDTLGIIASGENFPDALAAGPVAFSEGYALGLTKMNDVPNQVIAALQDAGVDRAVIVGGAGVVSQAVVDELEAKGIDVIDRLWGPNRDDTAAEVARWAVEDLGFSQTQVSVASGYNDGGGADALAGGPLSGAMGWPLLITRNIDVPGSGTLGFLSEYCPTLTDGVIYGGNGAVSAGAEAEMEEAASSCDAPSNQDFTVTPTDAVALEYIANPDTDTSDDRVYTVENAVAGAEHTIQLFLKENVTVDADGNVTFEASSGNATPGTVEADITVVNGTPVTPGAKATVTPTGDSFTFRVDGDADETIVPVVYFDANGDNNLDVDANGAPVEAELVGVGGSINYQPAEAGAGTIPANSEITEVDKAADQVIAGGLLYNYDANDLYYNGSVAPANQLTMAEFEAILTVGDELDGLTYASNEAFQSTFVIENLEPGAPTAAVETEEQNAVELTVTDYTPGATIKVYGDEDPTQGDADGTTETAFDDANLLATSATDGDTAEPGFQITVTGLDGSTEYDFYVTQTVDGEESDESNRVDATTTAAPGDVALTGATPNDVNDGTGSTTTVVYTFSEPVTVSDVNGFEVSPTNQPGIVYTSTNAVANAAGTSVTVTFGTALNDAANDVSYTATVNAGAVNEDNAAAAPNAEQSTTFAY